MIQIIDWQDPQKSRTASVTINADQARWLIRSQFKALHNRLDECERAWEDWQMNCAIGDQLLVKRSASKLKDEFNKRLDRIDDELVRLAGLDAETEPLFSKNETEENE